MPRFHPNALDELARSGNEFGARPGLDVVAAAMVRLESWDFVGTTLCEGVRGDGKAGGIPHKWTLDFLMAVGFWNFVGAGMFGFLINLPIVSYYEVGTMMTPAHGHAAIMGEFGVLPIGLTVFVLLQTRSDALRPSDEQRDR